MQHRNAFMKNKVQNVIIMLMRFELAVSYNPSLCIHDAPHKIYSNIHIIRNELPYAYPMLHSTMMMNVCDIAEWKCVEMRPAGWLLAHIKQH